MAENKNLKRGDLIEISRRGYQHWALYVGDGYVVHLVPPSEHANAGSSSLMSVVHNKATVKRDKLKDVAGNDKYRINNLLDGFKKYKPRRIEDILQDANSFVGKNVPYNLKDFNCEHFVMLLRYGVPHSQQVEDVEDAMDTTIAVLISAAGAFGIFVLAILKD